MATFLRSLERETALRTGRSPRPTFLDSHPSTPERAKSAAARAVALPRRAAPPIAGTRAAFLARLEGLLIGADPAEGVLRDGSFLHPEFGFGVRFPDGWRTENARTEVRAIDPREAAILVLLAQEAGEDARRAAQRYAERQGVSLLEAGPARVHGVAAFRARALLPTQQAVLALDLTWLPHRGVVYRIQGVTTQPELSRYAASFLRAAQSFRSLTDEERATIRERRLRLAKAREGETLAELSRRTGNLWSSSETAVMNGRNETERLRAGELVKIAVEAPYRRRGGP
jgi:predicted Zn-dependent protease